MDTPALHIQDLKKQIGTFELGPLNLTLQPGEITGYIGPNGAGKTTTMKCLMHFYYPAEGRIEFLGNATERRGYEWKQQVGYAGEQNHWYEGWNVERNLRFTSQFYPAGTLDYAMALTGRLELNPQKRVRDLSSGNRKKLAIIMAMAHRPGLLLLDEPFINLDPLVKDEAMGALRDLVVENNSAVFISTHVLNELSALADRLIFIRNGSIVAEDLVADLQSSWARIVISSNNELKSIPAVVARRTSGTDEEIISNDRNETLAALSEHGFRPSSVLRMSLEEIGTYMLREGRYVETL